MSEITVKLETLVVAECSAVVRYALTVQTAESTDGDGAILTWQNVASTTSARCREQTGVTASCCRARTRARRGRPAAASWRHLQRLCLATNVTAGLMSAT